MSKEKRNDINDLVTFKNSQGIRGRASLINITKDCATLEVYNPYSVVQLSEVLTEMEIFNGNDLIYNGEGVISNIIPTGFLSVCSVTLSEHYFVCRLDPAQDLEKDIDTFFINLRSDFNLDSSFVSTGFQLYMFLQNLRRLSVRLNLYKSDISFLNQLGPLVETGCDLLNFFEKKASQIDPEEMPDYKKFIQQILHPFLLCSPFLFRVFNKPLGFAGDYEMVNMILRDPFEGEGLYAKIINAIYLSQPIAIAHQNRIKIIVEKLKQESEKKAKKNERLRILNLGCGPAKEIQDFIAESEFCEICDFRLIDFNQEAIDYAKEAIKEVTTKSERKISIEFFRQSVRNFLKTAIKKKETNSFDFIYCTGLFDYLSDNICKKLISIFLSWLSQDGILLVTNVHKKNSMQYVMECIVEWNLIYRDEKKNMELVPPYYPQKVYTDPTGINLFLEIKNVFH